MAMDEKILLVDDELTVLQGYQRLLHRDFKTDIAAGGVEGLTAIANQGPYAVVVSDMRMPFMDGIQFLAKVKIEAPDTVRMMLTGHVDIETAVNAVNEGNIFRILTKPCSKETLAKTLMAGLEQHRLVTAEKELLEKTLSGSVHVLAEVLSLVNPAAFGRGVRVRRYVNHIVKRLGLSSPWRFEVAAMMSQLGCVTIDPETIDAVYAGQKLTPEEQARYDMHPLVARDLLRNIPRMEPVAWMIAHQNQADLAADEAQPNPEMANTLKLGADILRVTLNFDELLRKGASKTDALQMLSQQHKDLDPYIIRAMGELEPETDRMEIRVCPIAELSTGMILHQEVRSHQGLLIVAKGQEVTFPLILKLKNFYEKGAIDGDINVSMMTNPATAMFSSV